MFKTQRFSWWSKFGSGPFFWGGGGFLSEGVHLEKQVETDLTSDSFEVQIRLSLQSSGEIKSL